MTSSELRTSFLDFFRERGHTIVPSAPVVPHGDPTLLFTNAGMNQFKDVFLGVGVRDYSRAADTQKCIRVSGKHNDLEEVGHDTYHHTFFEMLGNWSFGDYYKEEAIAWAWELLTKVWGLPAERLHVTVYRSDDGGESDQEAYDIWARQPGLDPGHIHWFGAKDNFWEMGETGPCGPCSEIHFDRTPDLSGGPLVNAGVPEVIEIWNLVFIQYNRRPDRGLDPLPAKHVDTGMGFERICAVTQGKASNYDTDVFMPLIEEIARLSGGAYSGALDDRTSIAMRVLADHVRTLAFSIADGASPGNAGRGYVLRRLLRRAVKYAYIELGMKEPVLYRLVPVIVRTMGEVFPEVRTQQAYIEKIIRSEEESFGQTIERGIAEFNVRCFEACDAILTPRIVASGTATQVQWDEGGAWLDGPPGAGRLISWESLGAEYGQGIVLPGSDAFFLYDTSGFPLDLTQLLARERGMEVDVEGFNALMAEQKKRGREARKSYAQEAINLKFEGETEFLGYTEHETDALVVAVAGDGIVLDRTPFYAEMGGQQADHGELVIGGERLAVTDVHKVGSAFLHIVDAVEVNAQPGEPARAGIDMGRRHAIQRNHSATHIVHEALRRVLGSHVQQAGSLVAPDHLRFDFNHFEKIGEEEMRAIEEMTNAKIREAIEVRTEELAIEDARRIPNVKMFFGDKYGSRVRVVTIDPEFSVEFCGGTHVRNTADIGLLKITSEGSIQAGVRRIEAVTGTAADQLLLRRYNEIERLMKRLGVADRDLYEKVEQLLEEKRALEKELAQALVAKASGGLDAILSSAVEREGVRIASGRIAAADMDALKAVGDDLRNRLKSGIGMLGADIEGKATLVCVVTDDLVQRFSAGKIVGAAAKLVGGGGGGKPHMATAGGKDVEKLDDALARTPEIVAELAG
ncbi:MAG TPA: alanine--tRNA ligase [Candidatus Kapabacteria bacterium]|nr:alanine--tRNA ligase [Candidatus Kapabacteria bacterium]